MHNLKFSLIAGCLMYGILSCTSSSNGPAEPVKAVFDAASAKTAIEAENSKFISALKAGDSSGMASNYSSDAQLLPPNSAAVPADAIASFWGANIRAGVKGASLVIDDITGEGNLIAETGHFEIYGENNAVLDQGKYVVIWKKISENWKMYRDIWNSNNPMPAAK